MFFVEVITFVIGLCLVCTEGDWFPVINIMGVALMLVSAQLDKRSRKEVRD